MLEQLQKLGELKRPGCSPRPSSRRRRRRSSHVDRCGSGGLPEKPATCTVNLPVPAAQVVGLGSLAGIARVLGLEADNATVQTETRSRSTDSSRLALPKHAADHRQPSTTRRHAALVAVTHTLIESPRCAATQLRGIIRLMLQGPARPCWRSPNGGYPPRSVRCPPRPVRSARSGDGVFALLAVEAGDDDTLSHGDLDAGDDRAAQCDPARADRRRVARRYDGWVERERPVIETAPATEPRARRPMVPRWQNDV